MELLSAKDAAKKWNISQRRVAILCSENRVPGARMLGNMWIIPADAEKPADGRASRFLCENETVCKPFVKWAGGKSQILKQISQIYPLDLGKSIKKYCEPFVGGGAVLFDILNKYQLEEVYISDVNRELILTYSQIRDNPEEVIHTLFALEREYLSFNDEEKKEFYYFNRERFNFLKKIGDCSLEISALFMFLNRTCFNGLYRVNGKGRFNVPQGSYKNPTICDYENLIAVSKKLDGVKIVCGDYKEAADFIDDKTFAYFDPPYRPLTNTSNFTSYSQVGFDDEKQIELAFFIKEMSKRGAFIVASNSDPKNIDENDNFFDELYKPLLISRILASRAINSLSIGRGAINELLISNYLGA